MTDIMKRIYMDYAASTPVDRRVMAAMAPYFNEKFGNPGSLHWFGQEAEAAVFAARQKIARALACSPEEIIFTGSATEANNTVLRGIARMANSKLLIVKPKIIISSIEHESIIETAADLETEGVEVVRIPVSREGFIDLEKLKAALDERTILVSVMYANNEIGTIQPIREIAKIVKDFKERQGKIASDALAMTRDEGLKAKSLKLKAISYPLFHTDTVQAFQYLSCRPAELGVDLMTLSAHKIYGPKGIGMLYIKKTQKQENKKTIIPIITGGEQERGMRAGTENVPYIVGFGVAVELTEKMREKEAKRVLKLRDYFWQEIKKVIKQKINKTKTELNGSLENRLPNNLNIYFLGHKAQDLLIALDINGIATSSGSACSAHATEPSKVVMALGYSKERALSSLRFTFGRQTRKVDIDKTIKILAKALY